MLISGDGGSERHGRITATAHGRDGKGQSEKRYMKKDCSRVKAGEREGKGWQRAGGNVSLYFIFISLTKKKRDRWLGRKYFQRKDQTWSHLCNENCTAEGCCSPVPVIQITSSTAGSRASTRTGTRQRAPSCCSMTYTWEKESRKVSGVTGKGGAQRASDGYNSFQSIPFNINSYIIRTSSVPAAQEEYGVNEYLSSHLKTPSMPWDKRESKKWK